MAFNYMGFRSYLMGEEWETTLTEGNERVVDEGRDQDLESKIGKLTDKNQRLELEIKNLKESYEKKLEKKTAEVQRYAKRLEEQRERHHAEVQEYSTEHKCLERKISEQTKSLNAARSEKQKMERTYTANLTSKQQQLDDCSRSYNFLAESFNTLRDSYNNDVRKWAGDSESLKSRLTKKDEELRVTREELKEKTARLASAFEKRLKHDQRRVENTIEFNTPTDIEKDFSDFFDGERVDACDVIESILHFEEAEEEIDVEIYYQRLACIIFVTAYEQVKEAREGARDLFANAARWLIDETPRLGQELCISRKKGEFSFHFLVTIGDSCGKKDVEISRDVLDGLILSLKQTAHLCNLDCFENVVKDVVLERWNRYLQEEKTQLLPAVHVSRAQEVLTQLSDYIKACIRLAWRMVTQVPPLQLEYKSSKFDKAVHKLARCQWNTDDQRFGEVPSEDIACYLWPALLEGGGRVLFPGEVLCKLESDFLDYVHL